MRAASMAAASCSWFRPDRCPTVHWARWRARLGRREVRIRRWGRFARNTSGTVLKLQITLNKPSMTAAACGTLTGSYLTSTRTGGEAIPLATTTSSLGPFSSLAGTSK